MSKIFNANSVASPASNRKSFTTALEQYRKSYAVAFPEETIFLLTHAILEFDWNSKEIVIENIAELEELYGRNYSKEKFPDNLHNIRSIITAAVQQSKIELPKLDDIKIYPANPAIKRSSDLQKSFLSYSPKRSSFAQTATRHKMTDRTKDAVTHLLIDSVILKVFEIIKIEPTRYQNLPPKISESASFAGYLRDDLIAIEDQLYFSPIFNQNYLIRKEQRTKSAMADTKAAGLSGIKYLPFITEGGNIITCKDKDGNDTLLIAVSDLNFNFKDEFCGADFQEEDEKEPRYYEDYGKFCQRLKLWGESLGYNTIVIHRNLDHEKWRDEKNPSNVQALYHLDTFLNVADDVLLIPLENVITEESRDELMRTFAEKNIIMMDKNSRKKMTTNFITIDDNIIFSSPEVSSDIIENYCQRGFNCVIPPFELSLCKTDGIRCHTQEIPTSRVQKHAVREIQTNEEAVARR